MSLIYNKGASELDQCAHRMYDFANDRKPYTRDAWHRTSIMCWACGNPLETTYFEERLYAVRCSHCTIKTGQDDNIPMMLVKAGNPDKAADIYNQRDKLRYRSLNNTNYAVLANAQRYIEDFSESGIEMYIDCPSASDCTYDGIDDSPCVECKLRWLEEEWREP